jgi:hypothetical protein
MKSTSDAYGQDKSSLLINHDTDPHSSIDASDDIESDTDREKPKTVTFPSGVTKISSDDRTEFFAQTVPKPAEYETETEE